MTPPNTAPAAGRSPAKRRTRFVSEEMQTFEPFAKEAAYMHVNEKLVERLMKRLSGGPAMARFAQRGTGLFLVALSDRSREGSIDQPRAA